MPGPHPYLHHPIVGRIRRHGTVRHVIARRAAGPPDGCPKHPTVIGNVAVLPGVRTVPVRQSIPVVSNSVALLGGSGVIGGFGGNADGTVPPCVLPACRPGTSMPEPASVLLLCVATLVAMAWHMSKKKKCSILKKRTNTAQA